MSTQAASTAQNSLHVFISYSSPDRESAKALYSRLRSDAFVPWLDNEDLLPGQTWQLEIRKAVRAADVVLVCLSRHSTTRAGYVNREIKYALDVADEQPEGKIFLIPIRLEECDVPERLQEWQWVDMFEQDGYNRLLRALRARQEGNSSQISPAPSSPTPTLRGSSEGGGASVDTHTTQTSSHSATPPPVPATATHGRKRVLLVANRVLLILCIAATLIAVLLLFTHIADAVVAVIGIIVALAISLFPIIKEIPEKQWFTKGSVFATLCLLLILISGFDAYLILTI